MTWFATIKRLVNFRFGKRKTVRTRASDPENANGKHQELQKLCLTSRTLIKEKTRCNNAKTATQCATKRTTLTPRKTTLRPIKNRKQIDLNNFIQLHIPTK